MKADNYPLITIGQTGQDKQFQERGSEFQTTYFEFTYEAPVVIPLVEATDDEILKVADRSGNFNYLKTADEDIYSLSDGIPL
jgi:hypothetical protein